MTIISTPWLNMRATTAATPIAGKSKCQLIGFQFRNIE